jgi:Protein of unknown function (DUF3108)
MKHTATLSAATVLLGLLTTPLLAADTVTVSYDVSLGGANVMRADYAATLDNGGYTSSLNAKSVGVSKLFSKYNLSISASGKMDGAGVKPVQYGYFRKKNKKTKERAISFTPDGNLNVDVTNYGEAISATVKKGVTDPLTMVLKLSHTAQPCKGKHRVFDGRDVYDISLSGDAAGKGAVSCTVTYTPIAGAEFDEGDTEPTRYIIKLAPLGGKAGFVPVSMAGKSKGVAFNVDATGVTYNGAPVSY